MKFSIPNGPSSKAVLFNSVSLTVPALTAHTKGQVMRLPDFPAAAPELPPAGDLYAERAVLTEGIVQGASMLGSSGSTTAAPISAPATAQKQGGAAQPQQTQQPANPVKQVPGAR
ncbi:MAG: hypothetical protein V4544_04715 [Pseudomonadota bacterium]